MNILTSDLFSGIDFIAHGFFDRMDGESSGTYESLNVGFGRGDDENALKNREKIAQIFEISSKNLITLKQNHGDIVHVIDKGNKDHYLFKSIDLNQENEGDAIITNEKGILIGVATADCAPILLCDVETKYIAVIHAGWRGANGLIIENTIEKMKTLGCKKIIAAIGPCLQRVSFEIKDDLSFAGDRKYISYTDTSTLYDMQLQILNKLLANGVKSVSKMNIDTFSNTNYFSKRRIGNETGVQFSGIMLR